MNGLDDRDGLSGTGEPPEGSEPGKQDNRVLVLPVNGDSRKLTQILSNETSLKILELLGKKSMSATNIAEELNLPLTTVKYNLDSLVESDLIEVKQIKWSKKGRQVKIYESVEKLIVLVPSRSTMDKLSIISLLQKYIGVIGAAVFAAAGIEYLSAYMRAKKIIDATAPLRMGITGPTNETYPEATVLETVENENPNPEKGSNELVFDRDVPDEEVPKEEGVEEAVVEEEGVEEDVVEQEEMEDAVVEDAVVEEEVVEQEEMEEEAMSESPETVSEQELTDSGEVEDLASGADTFQEEAAAEVSDSDTFDSTPEIPSVPPEGITHLGGIHGLYDTLSLHPGVWFLFGCIFVIFLIIVREVYYKKKTK